MPNVTLSYTTASVTTSQSFIPLGVRGMQTADKVQFVGVRHKYLNGNISEQFIGFHRVIDLDLGILQDFQTKVFLLNFFLATDRVITSGSDFAQLAKEDFDKHFFEWIDNCQIGSQLKFTVIDRYVSNVFANTNPVVDVAYSKSNVNITGTEWSPQTLTTNSAPLDVDDDGVIFPTFNNATQRVKVVATPLQQGMIFHITQEAISGGNVTFQIAHTDYGQPVSSDGTFRANLLFIVMAKP